MEKVLYCLSDVADVEALDRAALASSLEAAGAHRIQLNVADAAVAAGNARRMTSTDAPPQVVVGAWVDSANDALRAPVDDAVATAGTIVGAYLVTESVPLRNTRHPARLGQRTPGMAHLAFFRRPPDQDEATFLQRWLDHHTQVALDTQDTFGYVQHVVTRALIPHSPVWHGIVEELFPAAAMADQVAFYDAVGDPDRQARHERAMIDSVQRFIDLSTIEVIPTSQYPMT